MWIISNTSNKRGCVFVCHVPLNFLHKSCFVCLPAIECKTSHLKRRDKSKFLGQCVETKWAKLHFFLLVISCLHKSLFCAEHAVCLAPSQHLDEFRDHGYARDVINLFVRGGCFARFHVTLYQYCSLPSAQEKNLFEEPLERIVFSHAILLRLAGEADDGRNRVLWGKSSTSRSGVAILPFFGSKSCPFSSWRAHFFPPDCEGKKRNYEAFTLDL